MIRVFIADDHAIVRAGIRQLLETASDIEVVGEASDGRKALLLLESTPCDVLLLDLSLPVLSGGEVLKRVREKWPQLPVLILSMYPEEQYARRLLNSGAAGYLSKDRSEDELLEAVRRLAAGRSYVTATVAEQTFAAPHTRSSAPHESLTAREHQIFTLIIQGRTVSEIAAELDLGGSTVSTHMAHIKAKLGVRTAAEFASYAHREGLIK